MVTGLTVDFCCIGLGEGREVTAGPGSPGQLWPSSPPPTLQGPGARVALPGLPFRDSALCQQFP